MNRGLLATIRRMHMLVQCARDMLLGRRTWWLLSARGWEYLTAETDIDVEDDVDDDW